MSCSYDLDQFTEDEIEAGVPYLFYGGDGWGCDEGEISQEGYDYKSDHYFQQYRDDRLEEKGLALRKYLSKKISGVSDFDVLKEQMVKGLLMHDFDSMCINYSESERLPRSYVQVVKYSNSPFPIVGMAIDRLTKSGAYQHKDIEENVREVLSLSCYDGVYGQVSEIQKYIHQTVDLADGKGAHKHISPKIMREFLSAIRLSIWKYRLTHINVFQIGVTIKNYKNIYKEEMSKNEENKTLIGDKRYIKHWKARHTLPIFFFSHLDWEEINDFLLKDFSSKQSFFDGISFKSFELTDHASKMMEVVSKIYEDSVRKQLESDTNFFLQERFRTNIFKAITNT
ncbi:hypothetical protein [Pelagibaculum spongiae]|uniref:Uncharacterized protein n=1 Tax=Pelagibaculum spongiae TaxID=2080658 RepID=A0A2V1GXF7_9GAMM|nr:hypothetical protein [Pelagibaculum spongiae]PVZ64535.1 hypothetical protein DC094_19685 [Pelagibaculum spongiae]